MSIDISVIIPVLNEKVQINPAIQRLFEQKTFWTIESTGAVDQTGTIEIIVVDGSSNGETLDCIKEDGVKAITSKPGRGRQMNAGAAVASGYILLFLHCDTALPKNGLKKILNTMKNVNCDAGAFDLSINADGFAYRLIEKTASLRSRLTRIPYGDQGLFIQKDFFFNIGQFKEIPIMEDVELMQRIKKQKAGLAFIDDSVLTSPRRWEKEGKVYGTLRNWVIITLYLFGVSPERLAGLYKRY
ncbi:MAG: TIGR04283 family arsenosugar biosynthesis glycosyltransferase [Desulfobacula sp.]|nr:TIGR04283 family arsenosugar biosynthesis glycosyltransferase [Desulfobacula sp.]